jgi:hypothetical protein
MRVGELARTALSYGIAVAFVGGALVGCGEDCEQTLTCSVAAGALLQGAACTTDDACANARCVDGVCCESACNAVCMSCGAGGVCVADAAGTDPEDECGVGVCDGSRACASGDVVWATALPSSTGSSGEEHPTAIALAPNGDIVVLGDFRGTLTIDNQTLTSTGSSNEVFVVALNATGGPRWANRYGNDFNEFVSRGLAVDASYNYRRD